MCTAKAFQGCTADKKQAYAACCQEHCVNVVYCVLYGAELYQHVLQIHTYQANGLTPEDAVMIVCRQAEKQTQTCCTVVPAYTVLVLFVSGS